MLRNLKSVQTFQAAKLIPDQIATRFFTGYIRNLSLQVLTFVWVFFKGYKMRVSTVKNHIGYHATIGRRTNGIGHFRQRETKLLCVHQDNWARQ